jgi:hypothetical protein
MSDVNIPAAVASGDAPQPSAEVAEDSSYDETLESAEDAVDSGEEVEASEDSEASPEKAIDAAAKKGDISKAQAQELKKKLKLKIDGEEFEEEIDFNDEENLKKHLQKSKAFDKRLKEFSGFKSQVDSLLEQLQKDPEAVLEKLGMNVDEMAEKRLARKIEEMKKSPEQIEKEKMAKQLEDLRQEKKRIQEEKEKAELEKMRNEQAQAIEHDISNALDNAKSILPKNNPWVLQRVAQTMLLAMNNGYKQVTAKDVIPLVEKQWKEELSSLFDMSSEETLEMLVGKSNMDRYRKKKLSSRPKAQTTTAKQVAQDTGAKKQEQDETSKPKKRYRDVFGYHD